ncbi:MAG: xanthine dehydrogenase family protein molybdopterin-binding subunit [Chloroflexi bacterium]|nr:MAG: xanthine dehydrogenase family protein molybdopterin-binding subunit [Chloroflexota bacterium]
MATINRPYRIIGTRPVRPDGLDKVTGKALYGADLKLPQMLYARLKRSPYAHARIVKIDASKALALPGVEAVVTAADFPGALSMERAGAGRGGDSPRKFVVGNFIAVDKALFFGHPVAAVAATSIHVAEDALDLIEVEYEVLPPVLTAQQSMAPGAPILHPELRTAEPLGVPTNSDAQTNVAAHLKLEIGDVDAAFAASDIVVEDEFHTGTAHQGYLEPHTATAMWNSDGSLVIYSSSQGSFAIVRDPLATILQMPPSRIRVVPLEIGGGFGGKNRIYCEPIAAMLSKKAGKPVRLTMTREEVIQATGPTSGAYIRGKIGANRDGSITAIQLWMAYEAGAFPGSSMGGGVNTTLGPYKLENVRIDGYDVVVNRPRNAAYRAPGVPAPTFAVESLVDEVCERLEMDPIDFRLKNAAREGDRRPNGVVLTANGNIEVMEAVKNSAHYRSELTGKNRGRGIAVGFWNANSGQHSINAQVNTDGKITLNGAAIDIGGLRATEAMTLAEVLGIPYEDIVTRTVDTDSIGYSNNTGGSSTGSGTAASVFKVGQQIRAAMTERAARMWEIDAAGCEYREDGNVVGPNDADDKPRTLSFKQIAERSIGTGGPISGHADNGLALGGPAYAGHIVDVEVDTDTGKVTVLRYTSFEDVGTAMHPSYVEGQIQGAIAQGIGMTLTEEYFYDEQGALRNGSLLDYRMPTALDLPMLDSQLIEVPNPGHPLGVRGVGEPPIVPVLGAISNAIYDAVGIRYRHLPATPTVILNGLLDRDEAGSSQS